MTPLAYCAAFGSILSGVAVVLTGVRAYGALMVHLAHISATLDTIHEKFTLLESRVAGHVRDDQKLFREFEGRLSRVEDRMRPRRRDARGRFASKAYQEG